MVLDEVAEVFDGLINPRRMQMKMRDAAQEIPAGDPEIGVRSSLRNLAQEDVSSIDVGPRLGLPVDEIDGKPEFCLENGFGSRGGQPGLEGLGRLIEPVEAREIPSLGEGGRVAGCA